MFKFDKVVDQGTGKEYMITGATFVGEEYDREPDGVNWYEVDLCPDDDDEEVPEPVDMVISNRGIVEISKNIHGERFIKKRDEMLNMNVNEAITAKAILSGSTLIIPAEETEQRGEKVHKVVDPEELKNLIGSKVLLVTATMVTTKGAPSAWFTFEGTRDNGKWQDLYIADDGTLFLSDTY